MPPGPTYAGRRAGSHRRSVKACMIKVVEAHWLELEKKGLLPKGKS